MRPSDQEEGEEEEMFPLRPSDVGVVVLKRDGDGNDDGNDDDERGERRRGRMFSPRSSILVKRRGLKNAGRLLSGVEHQQQKRSSESSSSSSESSSSFAKMGTTTGKTTRTTTRTTTREFNKTNDQSTIDFEEENAKEDEETGMATTPFDFAEEYGFGDVFAAVKMRRLLATSAPKRFERVAFEASDDLRAEAHRVLRRRSDDANKREEANAMIERAEELEREAKTWNLVNHLMGDALYEDRNGFEIEKVRTVAANRGEGNGYSGDVLLPPMDVRARLFVRDEKRDPVLFRTQRIVAWLEENQATKLRREAFESSGVRENAIDATSHGVLNALDVNCGTFKETALAVEQGATQDFEERELSQRLDMDGIVLGGGDSQSNDADRRLQPQFPSSSSVAKKGALVPIDAQNETKLLKQLWQIVRSGDIEQARELCVKCGQPWRAAALGGASGWSFVPVGENCDKERVRDDARVHAILRRENPGTKNGSFDEIPLHVQNELDSVDERVVSECLMMSTDDVDDSNTSNRNTHNSALVDRRRLWKWTLHKASRQLLSKLDNSSNNAKSSLTPSERERLIYEAAIYASLCGDVDGMMLAAAAESDEFASGVMSGDSYDAISWVLFRSIVDHCVDRKLMKRWDESVVGEFLSSEDSEGENIGFSVGPPIREANDSDSDSDDDKQENGEGDDIDDEYGPPRWPTREVVESCPPTPRAAFDVLEKLLHREGLETHRTIQKDLALGGIDNIVKNILCDKVFQPDSSDSIDAQRTFQRFAANLVLSLKDVLIAETDKERRELRERGDFFGSRGLDFDCDKIVGRYVVTLITEKRYSLVSLYASQLSAPERAEILSNFYVFHSSLTSPNAKVKRHEEASNWIPLEGEGNRRKIVRMTLDKSRFEEYSHCTARWLNSLSQWATRDVNNAFVKEARSFACKLLRERALRRTYGAVAQTFVDADAPTMATSSSSSSSFAQIGNEEFFNGELDAMDLIHFEVHPYLLDPETVDFEMDKLDSKNVRELNDWVQYFECCELFKKWRASAKRSFVPPEDEIEDAYDTNSVASVNRAKRSEHDLAIRPFHENEKRESDSALAAKCVESVLSLLGGENSTWLKDDDIAELEDEEKLKEQSASKEFWFRLTTDVYDFFEVEHELLASKADSFHEALKAALSKERIEEDSLAAIDDYSVYCEAKGEETIGIRALLKLRYLSASTDKKEVKLRTMRALSQVIKALFLDVNQLETSEEDEFGRYDDEHEQDAIRSASPSSLSFASRRLCEFVCIPSLLIQAAECEAWCEGEGYGSKISELMAHPKLDYAAKLFTKEEIERVLKFRRLGAIRRLE